MSTRDRWIAALLALSAVTACATSAPPGARSAAPVSGAAAPTQLVYGTGSRIPVPAGPGNGPAASTAPTQSFTQDDLKTTGRTDMGAALRSLSPITH